jgi:dTDP-glucose 4,6-dehydratase
MRHVTASSRTIPSGSTQLVTCCGNNYGPRQFPEKFRPLMLSNALNDEPIPVYGGGRNVRDWI